jgi:hypothetical protein
MRAVDRRERDERVMRQIVAGCSYRDFARAVGLRSPQSVGNIVAREMGRAGGSRGVITEFGRAVFVERSEALLCACWPAAMAGDHRAAELCERVLDEQARFYGLAKRDCR